MISEEVCIAKIEPVSTTLCNIELIFNGATEVTKEKVELEQAAYVESILVSDEYGVVVETSHQVGDAGLKPFVDKLKEMYPNVLLIAANIFDKIVEEQVKQARKISGEH